MLLLEMIFPSDLDNSNHTNTMTDSGGGGSSGIAADQLLHDTLTTAAYEQHHQQQVTDDLPCFKDLIAVLIECFTIISLGYLSGRFKLISPEAKDIGTYLSTFALPLVIFLNIAQMEIHTIHVSFLFSMLISKLFIFIIVTIITLAISYPANFSYSGALSILCTQSNDFALGYPLIKSLYGKTRPEMLNYLNLMGPLQLLIINPLGIVMLEFGKSRSNRELRRAEAARKRKACLNCSSIDPTNRPPPPDPAHAIKTTAVAVTTAAAVATTTTAPTTIFHDENQISHSANGSHLRARYNNRINNSIPHSVNNHHHFPQHHLQPISSSLINLAEYRQHSSNIKNDNNNNNNNSNNNAMDHSLYLFENRNNVTIKDDGAKYNTEDKDQLITHTGNTIEPSQQENALIMTADKDGSHVGAANIKRKNIKSLSLVMPATVMPIRTSSEKSIDSIYDDQVLSSYGGPPLQQLIFRSRTNSISGSSPSVRAINAPVSTDERNVYTRPKLFNIVGTSLWFSNRNQQQVNETSCSPIAGGGGGGGRPAPGSSGKTNDLNAGRGNGGCTCWNADGSANDQEPMVDLGFVKALLTNPLIIASVVALAVNLTNGPELPKFVTKVSNTIAASFAAPALFVVGLSMSGKFELIAKNPNDFLLSSVLAAIKVMVLPCIMRTIVLMVLPHYVGADEVHHLADFSYLYGLLPTAPGACIIVKQYDVMTNVVAICMLLSTIISGPLMLATSAVIYQADTIKPEDAMRLIGQVLRASSGVTLTLSLLTLYLLWTKSRQISYLIRNNVSRATATHLFTFLLALTQLVISIGGIMWLFVDLDKLQLSSILMDDAIEAQPNFQWSHGDGDELIAEEMSHAIQSTTATSNQRLLVSGSHGQLVEQSSHELSSGPLCLIQFVISSGGILMARFIILCIVMTNFARRSSSSRFSTLACSMMMKVYPIVSIAVVVFLIFEAHHLTCSPAESSLPTWPTSIYLRLIFNTILLCLTIVPFAAKFRIENKASWTKLQESSDCQDDDPEATLKHRRRFVTSSASLTSETSSAITTSTNLETSCVGGGGVGGGGTQGPNAARATTIIEAPLDESMTSDDQRQNVDVPCLNDSLSTLVADSSYNKTELDSCDHGTHECLHEPGSNLNIGPQVPADVSNVLYSNGTTITSQLRKSIRASNTSAMARDESTYRNHISLDTNQNDSVATSKVGARANDGSSLASGRHNHNHNHHRLNLNLDNGQSQNKTTVYDDSTQNNDASGPGQNYPDQRWCTLSSLNGRTEFDKYSILFVFMIFQVILNITSMIQQLCQDRPFGTYMSIEITNVALNFGQGLVTFLVIGLQVVSLKDLISVVGARSQPVQEQNHAIV